MNNLNSLIIEGTAESVEQNCFVLVTTDKIKDEIKTYRFPIHSDLGRVKNGNHVRIVGKLCNCDTGIYIKAEHIEIR